LFTVRPERLAATASWLGERAAAWRDRLEALKREAEFANASKTCGRGPENAR